MADAADGHKVLNSQENERTQNTNSQKILVAVDYQASTSEVFAKALQIAKAIKGRLMIFHCLQESIAGIPDFLAYAGTGSYSSIYSQELLQIEEQIVREAGEELQVWLDSFVQKARKNGIEAEANYLIGDSGHQICAYAKSWGADLIIIGRRGRTGLSELLLGSVSNYVIHHAHCSVLVVQHHKN
jgi:nucleotide-binding universal stress UspA family protein